MATERQKIAARRNLEKARRAQSAGAHGRSVPRSPEGMSTAEKNRLDDNQFAFQRERNGIEVEADGWRELFVGDKEGGTDG